MNDNWNLTETVLPPENVEVQTMNSIGMTTNLVLQDGLWFLPDYSIYVYYVPMYWKEK